MYSVDVFCLVSNPVIPQQGTLTLPLTLRLSTARSQEWGVRLLIPLRTKSLKLDAVMKVGF